MPQAKLPAAFLEARKKFLSPAEFQDFEVACTRPLRKSIRINTLKISVADFQKRAKQKNWKLTPIPWCAEGFWIERPEEEQKGIPLGKTGEHQLGLFYVQEASSMLPVKSLEFGVGSREQRTVLDMAAAPGSKTTQLAATMKNGGLIVANEFSASRIKGLFSNLERLGIANVALTHFDGERFARFAPEAFDVVLLDAPCTGEGTIRKDPEALKSWSERRIQIAAGVQKKLITAAFTSLKPGGILIYSTCTLAPEENEQVCHSLQEKFGSAAEFESLKNLFPGAKKSVTPEGFLRIWPQTFDTEGFFVARIRRTAISDRKSEIRNQPQIGATGKGFPFIPIPKGKFQQIKKYYSEHFGFQFSFDSKRLREREREIWLFPQGIEELIGKIRFDRIGIKLCEIHRENIKTSHETAIGFGSEFTKNIMEILDGEATDFYAGRDLSGSGGLQGEILLRFEGFPLGLGKVQQGSIKNQLPRVVVRSGIVF